MKTKYTYIQKKRLIIVSVGILIAVIFLAWFLFRHIKGLQADSSSKDEYIKQQRKDYERTIFIRDSLQRRKEDSMYMFYMGIGRRVETKIINREIFVPIFLDTAPFYRKSIYIDSLLGPK